MAPSTELGLNHFQPPPKIGCVGWGLEEPQEQRESLLLDLPSPKQCREREQESHLGPLQGIDHLQEAEKVDLEALKARDPALKELLEDDTFALATPAAMSAFELYRRSLIALDAGRELAQKAFRAVVQDNAEELRRLFETTTLRWDAENGGGQSLLEVALERQKHRAQTVLQEMKRRQTEAAAHADEPL
ncbi:unnamed protein product [Durusdinium trenchii]|uniref:Uncharacterized protein n=1 Tax=Durusdinium trenchii TaxID=1381693 RepID=A0ABP0LPM3_9DINO